MVKYLKLKEIIFIVFNFLQVNYYWFRFVIFLRWMITCTSFTLHKNGFPNFGYQWIHSYSWESTSTVDGCVQFNSSMNGWSQI